MKNLKKHSFTQLELIVCCMAALLFCTVFFAAVCKANAPTLSAKTILCQSGLKQLGTQIMLYADDHKVLPYINKRIGRDPSFNSWNGLLYHGGYLETEKPHKLGAAASNSKLLRCSAETDTAQDYNYGLNIFVAYMAGVDRSRNHQLAQEASIRLRDISDPGKRVYISDSRSCGVAADIGSVFRHENSFNAWFFDGHIRNFTFPLDAKSHELRVMFSKNIR